MNPSSTPAPEIATDVWQLRYLLCTSGQTGTAFVDERTVTKWDTLHNCQAYICKSKTEFDRRNREVVCKTNKRFFTAVELYNPATGERRKIDDTLQFTLTSQAGQAAKSPGSYPGNAGSSPAPATMPADGTADDGFAKELAGDWQAAQKAAFDSVIESTGAQLSQMPGGLQSGGVVVEAAPCKPKGTISDPPAVDADAGTPDPTASLAADASASPAPEPVSARAPASKPKPAKKGKK